jgi:hypothetical protein
MVDLATLRDLHRRLREATGPDRKLDTEMMKLVAHASSRRLGETFGPDDKPCSTPVWEYNGTTDYVTQAPTFTGSIDAAVALIERAFPGRAYFFGKGRDRAGEPLYGAVIHDGMSSRNRELGAGEHNANLAIALCIALVSALIAIGEGEHANG